MRGRDLPGHQHGHGADDHAGRGGGAGRARAPSAGADRGRRLARLDPARADAALAVLRRGGEGPGRGHVPGDRRALRAGRARPLGHRGLASTSRTGRSSGTRDRGYTDINALPRRPFHLVDFEAYARSARGLRWLLYCTSHGCPWDCSYCSNASVYGRNWKPLTPEATVAEMARARRAATGSTWSTSSTTTTWCAATARSRSPRACCRQASTIALLHPDAHRPDRPPDATPSWRCSPAAGSARIFFGAGVGLGQGDALGQQAARPGDRPTARPSAATRRASGPRSTSSSGCRPRRRTTCARRWRWSTGSGGRNPDAASSRTSSRPTRARPSGRRRCARGVQEPQTPRGVGGLLSRRSRCCPGCRARSTRASSASATTSASATPRSRW